LKDVTVGQARSLLALGKLDEAKKALASNDQKQAEDIVDAMIDLCVVAIGTLDAFQINAGLAWDVVHEANMNKEVGIKPSRPNPLGLPDLIKPEGWTPPSHAHNHGLLSKLK
jgi:predicted HAD superfamily Cof-like phosphohydrolase